MSQQEHFASKADVANVRSEVAHREIGIQTRISETMKEVSEAKSVASDAQSAVANAKSEVFKWVAGVLIVYTVVLIGIMVGIIFAVLEFGTDRRGTV